MSGEMYHSPNNPAFNDFLTRPQNDRKGSGDMVSLFILGGTGFWRLLKKLGKGLVLEFS